MRLLILFFLFHLSAFSAVVWPQDNSDQISTKNINPKNMELALASVKVIREYLASEGIKDDEMNKGMNIYVDKLEELMDELKVEIVAPTHGLPVTDLAATMPKVREGLISEGNVNT